MTTTPCVGFRHSRQAIQVTRWTRRAKTARAETVYAITDLDSDDITPAKLADAIRAHWGTENHLHWVAGRELRRGSLPGPYRQRAPSWRPLRNLAISVYLTGAENIAASRRVSRHPLAPLRPVALRTDRLCRNPWPAGVAHSREGAPAHSGTTLTAGDIRRVQLNGARSGTCAR